MWNRSWYHFPTADVRLMITQDHYHYGYKGSKYSVSFINQQLTFFFKVWCQTLNRKIMFQAAVVVVVWVSPLSQEWWFQFVSSSCIQPKNNVLTCIELQMNVMYNSMGAIYTVLLKGKIACESKARHKTSLKNEMSVWWLLFSTLTHTHLHLSPSHSLCLRDITLIWKTARLPRNPHFKILTGQNINRRITELMWSVYTWG